MRKVYEELKPPSFSTRRWRVHYSKCCSLLVRTVIVVFDLYALFYNRKVTFHKEVHEGILWVLTLPKAIKQNMTFRAKSLVVTSNFPTKCLRSKRRIFFYRFMWRKNLYFRVRLTDYTLAMFVNQICRVYKKVDPLK